MIGDLAREGDKLPPPAPKLVNRVATVARYASARRSKEELQQSREARSPRCNTGCYYKCQQALGLAAG